MGGYGVLQRDTQQTRRSDFVVYQRRSDPSFSSPYTLTMSPASYGLVTALDIVILTAIKFNTIQKGGFWKIRA